MIQLKPTTRNLVCKNLLAKIFLLKRPLWKNLFGLKFETGSY